MEDFNFENFIKNYLQVIVRSKAHANCYWSWWIEIILVIVVTKRKMVSFTFDKIHAQALVPTTENTLFPKVIIINYQF